MQQNSSLYFRFCTHSSLQSKLKFDIVEILVLLGYCQNQISPKKPIQHSKVEHARFFSALVNHRFHSKDFSRKSTFISTSCLCLSLPTSDSECRNNFDLFKGRKIVQNGSLFTFLSGFKIWNFITWYLSLLEYISSDINRKEKTYEKSIGMVEPNQRDTTQRF